VPLRPLPYRELKRKLEAAGFREATQKGSHVKFVKTTPNEVYTATVPRHREVTIGTLRSVLRQAGLTPDEFLEL
jgi:predicted RNA binding protein YcfA (HicA-like mRNA interferase family)